MSGFDFGALDRKLSKAVERATAKIGTHALAEQLRAAASGVSQVVRALRDEGKRRGGAVAAAHADIAAGAAGLSNAIDANIGMFSVVPEDEAVIEQARAALQDAHSEQATGVVVASPFNLVDALAAHAVRVMESVAKTPKKPKTPKK